MNRTDPAAPVLTIDGPSGAGKGTVSARVADRLGWHLLDSGVVYRALAVYAIEQQISSGDHQGLEEACREMQLLFLPTADGVQVHMNERRIDRLLRTEEVSQMASRVASVPRVRQALLDLQRSFRRPPGLVADGRDMGTVVFPDAAIKVFLDASLEERARRRHKQLNERGESVKFSRLFRDLAKRDRRDRERAISPMVPAADAITIDSTNLTINQVVDRILGLVAR